VGGPQGPAQQRARTQPRSAAHAAAEGSVSSDHPAIERTETVEGRSAELTVGLWMDEVRCETHTTRCASAVVSGLPFLLG